jgi:menaquinone-dependent protoporphyrinogen IX oxidase
MKGIIIYKGKYGATQQYAEWAGKKLNLPVMVSHDCTKEDLAGCDFLVIGTSVYIGMLVIKEWIKNNSEGIEGKPVFLFVVCGTPSDEKEKLESYVQSSVPEQIRKQCTLYFLPGRLIYKKLSWLDKLMLRMGSLLSGSTGAKKAMLTDYDAVKKENIIPLVNDVKILLSTPSIKPVAPSAIKTV